MEPFNGGLADRLQLFSQPVFNTFVTMRVLTILCFLLVAFGCFGQDHSLINATWKLESISRANGTIVFYNRVTDQAEGYPPVFWKFSPGAMAITGDLSVPATAPQAQDTVEAHLYSISGDTLILIQYFTKGLELATITNSPKAFYRIDKLEAGTLHLLLYDRLANGNFRPMDMYSRRYVFSR